MEFQGFINRGDQPHNTENDKATDASVTGAQKILHRDLKPGNIFLSGNQEAKVHAQEIVPPEKAAP